MNIKLGDIAIFSNGEEAVVETIVNQGGQFRISFSNEVSGWIGDELKDRSWTYNERGILLTEFPNGNNIVKVITC